MNKYIFLFPLLFFPLFVSADTYSNAAGTSQMIADSFGELWIYFFEDVPSLFQRAFNYAFEFAFSVKLYFQKMILIASWGVAKELIDSFQIMSKITANITLLPVDVRQALVDMRLFDAINLLFQAQVTRFVLRV